MTHVTGGFKSLNIPEDGDNGWRNPLADGPIALFNANTIEADLTTQKSGAVTFRTNVNERAAVGGEFGWLFRMNATTYPDDNSTGDEKRYSISPAQFHCWEEVRVWQPANYFNRFIAAAFSVEPLSVTANWLDGDTVTTSTGTATYVSSKDQSGEGKHFFKDLSASAAEVFPAGGTVTNSRTAESFTIDRSLFIAANKKLLSLWIDDGINGGSNGYSQSGMFFENDGGYDDNGNAKVKFNTLGSAASGEGTSGFTPSEVTPVNKYVFDTADNGSWVSFIVERRRSETANSGGGIARLYKKTERVGSDTENWTLLYQATNLQQFHSAEYNGFNYGYLFGAANGGYTEQTDFYLNKYALYNKKPQALIDAGL